jgi:hypothetical protein
LYLGFVEFASRREFHEFQLRNGDFAGDCGDFAAVVEGSSPIGGATALWGIWFE